MSCRNGASLICIVFAGDDDEEEQVEEDDTEHVSSTCVDDDACLQKNPVWGESYTCAGSTQYCNQYYEDMACCPKSCERCEGEEEPTINEYGCFEGKQGWCANLEHSHISACECKEDCSGDSNAWSDDAEKCDEKDLAK